MKTYEALEAVLAKIEDPKKWCKGSRLEGDRRCALGAFDDVLFEHEDRSTFAALQSMLGYGKRQLGALAMSRMAMPMNDPEQAIASFNDNHTHGEVVELFKAAIRAGKENEASKVGNFFAVPIKAPYAIDTNPSPEPTWTTWTTLSWDEAPPKAVPIPSTVAYKQIVKQLTTA